MAASDPLPLLYSFRRCPYAMRARLALSISGQACVVREVLLRDKPPEMLARSAKGTVPVLVLSDGTVMDESLDIMRWALRRHDPHNWLSPEGGTLDDMLALISENDGPFKEHLDRYKYSTRYDDADPMEHREQGVRFLETLNARLETSAFLFGDHISLADIAIFPFVRQFANADRAWFDAAALKPLQDWLDHHVTSDLFAHVMQKYPVWAPGDVEPLLTPVGQGE